TLDNGPTKSYSSTNVPVAIPDLGTATSKLTIADIGQIVDINVTLNISHTYDSDLVVSLIGPDNTTVTLFSNVGGSGDNFTNTVLDDQAATLISSGVAPFTGTYRPSPGMLSSFNSHATNGTWTLKAQDTAAADTGT